jgi:mRNA-degrading endonuclease RelE of RelBE toxin-antitoxin system
MSSNNQPFDILLTPQFQKDLKQLAKRYRSIRKDLEPLVTQLKAGDLVGDKLSGLSREVFKVRLTNSDIRKGKSAGYRVIYYIKTKTSIVLIAIYSKSDLSDISNQFIEEIIRAFEN